MNLTKPVRRQPKIFRSAFNFLASVVLLLASLATSFGAALDLQGQNKGNTNWTSGNLTGWVELDYIPCRVFFNNTPVNNQTITIYFPHLIGGTTPGFQNLSQFTPSSNAVITSGPTLTTDPSGTWSYTFTVSITNNNPGFVQFRARLAAGAHVNTGSSLKLSGDPSNMGTLQVFKPGTGPGLPDLAITKTGTASVVQGGTISYTLSYTNKANTTNTAVGTQISDILPPGVIVNTNTLPSNADLVGSTIFFDLTNVVSQASGQYTFSVQVPLATPLGTLTNFSQILSSEDDANPSDNTSTWLTTVTSACTPPVVTNNPVGAVKCPGDSITFIVGASGTSPLRYQWRKNGSAISGATNSTYTIASIVAGDSGTYSAVVTNACGTATSSGAVLNANDTTPPTITCPADVAVSANSGCAATNVTLGTPVTGDNCTVASVVNNAPASFALGTNFIVWVVTDTSGNTNSCTQRVVVTDVTNPSINCPADVIVSVNSGCAATNVALGAPVTGDNCSVANVVNNAPASFPLGTNIVTWTVTDGSGNTASCTQRVIVRDTTNPVITCPENIVVSADAGSCSRSNVTFLVTATDNCSVSSIVSEPASGSTFPIGTTVVTNTATDASGNQSVCTFTVTVNDTENPVITCPSDIVVSADGGSCSKSNVTFLVTATDNCSVSSIVSTPASGSTFAIGTTTVTNTVTDASGNQSICTFTVTVNDTENPAITCPSDIIVSADGGQCSRSNVTFNVTATDNCSVSSIVSSPESGSTFAIGTTTVTNTATDASGNQTICTFAVTVNDTENPAITCPSDIVVSADGGQCSRSNVTFLVTATDNCTVSSIVSSPASGSTFPIGTTIVTNTATDASGNQSVCTFTVTVNDAENPAITCPSDIIVSADAGSCSKSNVTFLVTPTDNCSVSSIVSSPASGSTFPIGTTTVTNTATDASGNQTTCTFTVTVNDTENPAINCPDNIVVSADGGSCSKSNVTFNVTATDNCSVSSIVSSPASGSTFPIGTTTVTNTATDASGNQTVCTFTVTVNDTENPVITCPTDIVVSADAGSCSKSNVMFNVTATDNCTVSGIVSLPPSGSTFPIGTTVVTNTATDASGNQTTCTFTVTVNDTENPAINCPSDIVVSADGGSCSRNNVTFLVTATDNCSVSSIVSEPASGSTFPIGTTTVTNTATDASGNQTICTFTVTVNDTENPVINCPDNIVVSADGGSCSKSNVTFNVTATDNCTVNSIVSSPASGSTFPIGTSIVTNTATDASGNQTICTFTVTVNDTENPAISCPSDIVVSADAGSCSKSNVMFNVTATDNCTVSGIVSEPASGSTFPIGTTTVTNTVTDASGNQTICTFTVTVNDAENPGITCPSDIVVNADTGSCNKSNVTFLVTVSDNCSVSSMVSEPASGSTFSIGTTTVTNTATDASGNQTICTFAVTVNDTENPAIVCPENIVLSADGGQCSRSNVMFEVTASDNCSVSSIVSTPPSGSTFPIGATTVTNIATDAGGNTTVCTFTVTVNDTEAPAITCPEDLIVSANAECTATNVALGSPTTSDNCSVADVVNDAPGVYALGTTVVTWTVTDASGNTNSCAQRVIVRDTTNPVITCSSNLILIADAGQCSRSNVQFTVTATDNCSVASLTSVPTSGSTLPIGVTTVTNTAVDASGNQAVCTFTVTVTDTEQPTIACPADLIVSANAGCTATSVALGEPVTSDNCSVASVTSNAPSIYNLGTNVVKWTVTDGSGNTNSCTQRVVVRDTTAPTIICPEDRIVAANFDCSATNVFLGMPVVDDNCSVAGVTNDAVALYGITPPLRYPVGTNLVTWTVTDGSGNTAACTQRVIVRDTLPPFIGIPNNIVQPANPGQCSRSNVNFLVIANDNCAVTNLTSTPPSGSTFPIGTTIVTNTAMDSSGNTSVRTFTVTINDTQNPIIHCPTEPIIVSANAGLCSRSNVMFTVTATDNCTVTNLTSTPASGSTFPIGTTIVTSIATDASGNQSTCTFNVIVRDTQLPVVTCSSNLVLTADAGQCSRSNVNFTVTATDNCTITNLMVTPPSGSAFPIGTTTVTNTATDASGNKTTCTFTVTVNDTQNPVITCPLNIVASPNPGHCSRSNVTFKVTATDNCSVSSIVSSPASGSTFPIGTTTVTNTATDASGNQSVCTFTVTVIDAEIPVITCPANIVVSADAGSCSKSNVTFNVTATDNCTVTNIASSRASGSTFPIGTTTVTNTATDASGNKASCTFTVTVLDNEPPVIVCPQGKTVVMGQSWTFDNPSASDNCSAVTITVTGTSTNAVCGNAFTAVRTWRATDGSGNTAECSQTVSVIDLTPPAVTILTPTNGTIFLAPASFAIIASAQDTNGAISQVEFFLGTNSVGIATNGSPNYSVTVSNVAPGSYTLLAVATDACGNQATSTPVNISVLERPPLIIMTNLYLNPQSGYYEEVVRVFNPTAFASNTVGVLVFGVQSPIQVVNYTLLINGIPYVQNGNAIPPGGFADIKIKLYVPLNVTNVPPPTLVAVVLPPAIPARVDGTPVTITRARFLPDRSFLLNFGTVAGSTYFVEYSEDDMVTWSTSPQTVTGTGFTAQFIDDGPPATSSFPNQMRNRFYRVKRVP